MIYLCCDASSVYSILFNPFPYIIYIILDVRIVRDMNGGEKNAHTPFIPINDIHTHTHTHSYDDVPYTHNITIYSMYRIYVFGIQCCLTKKRGQRGSHFVGRGDHLLWGLCTYTIRNQSYD